MSSSTSPDGGASVEGEGHGFNPWGFDGGLDGRPAALRLNLADGSDRELPSKAPYMPLKAGDRFICVGPAGGGYGDPLKRDPRAVLDDVIDGLISRDSALRDYRVAVTSDLRLDEAKTLELRAAT